MYIQLSKNKIITKNGKISKLKMQKKNKKIHKNDRKQHKNDYKYT